jgi:hypothetical protein
MGFSIDTGHAVALSTKFSTGMVAKRLTSPFIGAVILNLFQDLSSRTLDNLVNIVKWHEPTPTVCRVKGILLPMHLGSLYSVVVDPETSSG